MKKKDNAAAKTALFPVVLFDGERELTIGNININQNLVFNDFQTMMSQLIGIHHDDLSTYLVKNTNSNVSQEERTIPITDDVNFAAIVRERRNCYFFVVLKRLRTECRMIPGTEGDLLRTRWNLLDMNKAQMAAAYSPHHYNKWFPDLVMQSQNYRNTVLNPRFGYNSPSNVNTRKMEQAYPRAESSLNRSLCRDCTAAQMQGTTAEFHLCVYDEILPGFFRSPAGPIARRR